METEFKYSLSGPEMVQIMLQDPLIRESVKKGAKDDIEMHAVYFDTEDEDFRKAGIAYRLRQENDRLTATIKWDAHVDKATGLHEREEVNLVVNDETLFEHPVIEIFESSDAYPVLRRAAGDKRLIKTVEMVFNRQLIKVNTDKSLSAISFDIGWIDGERGRVPVNEVEVEWYHGDEEDFKEIAGYLADKYNLVPEKNSKLQRGFVKDINDIMIERKVR